MSCLRYCPRPHSNGTGAESRAARLAPVECCFGIANALTIVFAGRPRDFEVVRPRAATRWVNATYPHRPTSSSAVFAAPSPDGCLCYIVEVMVRDSGGQTERRAAASSSMLSVMLSISRSEQVEMDGQQRLDRLGRNGSNVFAFRQVAENAGTRE